MIHKLDKTIHYGKKTIQMAGCIPESMILLLARLGMGGIFWRSGMTKITLEQDAANFTLDQFLQVITLKWQVSDFTYVLFESDYDVPVLPPELAAHMALLAELTLPVLLLIGLASRLSALAMLGMTAVIQTFVYPGLWPDHSLWAAALLLLIAKGSGKISVDHLIARKLK